MSERWFKQYRMDWITETLRVFGFINREHLMRKFGISTPQASKDINDYLKLYPNTMLYNLSRKTYEATNGKDDQSR